LPRMPFRRQLRLSYLSAAQEDAPKCEAWAMRRRQPHQTCFAAIGVVD
jgi:hypothetical protein